MSDVDPAAFIERFSRVWAAPEPDEFGAIWQPEGTLFHPTMAAPIPQSEIPDYLRRVKAMMPDISLRVLRWAASDDVVLVEWEITGTYGGEHRAWRGADRFTLRDDRAVEGVAYFDTHWMWAVLDPDSEQGSLDEVAAKLSDAPRSI